MRLETKYEWELEGDLAASVWLELVFEARVVGVSLMSLELIDGECYGVTFAKDDDDIVCDGCGHNPSMPLLLACWFVARFQHEWDTNQHLRNEFHEMLEQRAIAEHYQRLAKAGAA